MAKGNTRKSVDIEAVRHKDKRKNIPTKELSGFVATDETKPKTLLYPRDPSLDPQLVWKGKDEQDAKSLEVPSVPIYIQEKIHPKYIIEELRAEVKKEKTESQMQLFADFNGLEFQELVEFYQHEQSWSNRMILGDSLLVMTSLAEKEGLKSKVQMIYIDPPYGISFGSNWQVSTRRRDVKDGRAEETTRQPEQIKAFRDTWKLGIHSYLAYLRDRLVVARDLLTDTGSVFVQIGDENVHLVRCLMDEVFGSENFCGLIAFVTTGGIKQNLLANRCDFLLWYSRQIELVKYRQLYFSKSVEEGTAVTFTWLELPNGERRGMTAEERENTSLIPQGAKIYRPSNITTQGNPVFAFEYKGKIYERPWKTTPIGMWRMGLANRLHVASNSLSSVNYLDDFPVSEVTKLWTDTFLGSFAEDKIYAVQTSRKTIERCVLMTTDPGDLVIDPTCGSGTTAYVAEQWGRRWITLDTSRVALTLARTRLMSARFPYYLLADSLDGIKKEAELTSRMPPDYKTEGDIKKGFVYKRVPHITLKSIANNSDIKEGMTREQIDAAIVRHADTEILYDQPYEDNRRIRVTGPFTVESLSPHRVISADDNLPSSEQEARRQAGVGQFETMILDNLKKAGVQNTIKNERLKFDRLEPYAGEWIHAVGEYTEKDNTRRRVAVCIGPEYGTVSAELVKEAAKEAVKGVGFDLLIICGFAFDPHVSEEAKRYGKLTILVTRMNPDLAMGDELLKSTGAGNLFMVFGEPDLDIKKQKKDGKIMVTINGLDVYDPTTGQIRSNTTDDIACWFIDTDYNEESFFVRHAYFTSSDEPYEKLKRTLRAEIDEAVWLSLYSTVSRPFDPPQTGKIAIKVINHYGDEVLKVYEVK
ncbi:site-specific DNA-methyltransferase [Chloroflexota bacterium]